MFVTRGESSVNLDHVSLIMVYDKSISFYRFDNNNSELDGLPDPVEVFTFKTDEEAEKAYKSINQHINALQL